VLCYDEYGLQVSRGCTADFNPAHQVYGAHALHCSTLSCMHAQ
jgi:hypothetical protein